jgi:hypothetical protein
MNEETTNKNKTTGTYNDDELRRLLHTILYIFMHGVNESQRIKPLDTIPLASLYSRDSQGQAREHVQHYFHTAARESWL